MSVYKEGIFPVLARYDAESVHDRSLQLLGLAERHPLIRRLLKKIYTYEDPKLRVSLWDLDFPNPLGVAAGFDNNARVPNVLGALGFGFVEIGTVTPRRQEGNPKPRIFRLIEDEALINRMGFPSDGMASVERNLGRMDKREVVLGINVGANKVSFGGDRVVDDYVAVVERLSTHADYLVVNVSSPNTDGLRQLQNKEALGDLLDRVLVVRDRMSEESKKPVLLKIGPDFDNPEQEIDDMLDVVMSREIDGVIATNTTVSREGVTSPLGTKHGGLSGRPIRDRSTKIISHIYKKTEGRLPIIGVGGVLNAAAAADKFRAGASLVQAYTGFVYGGPLFARETNEGLVKHVEDLGLNNICELRGVDVNI